jgi:hypothetical protein
MTAHHLLVVSDSLAGGLGAAVRSQAAWFTARGWDVEVVAPGDGRSPAAPVRHVVTAVPATARDARGMVALRRATADAVSRFRPDVVHCHGLRCFAATRAASFRAPYVTLHGVGGVPGDPAGYGLVRQAGVSAVPMLAARAFSAAPGIEGRWTFAPHASPALAGLDRLPMPRGDTMCALWLGRIEEQKRPDVFVRAIADAARRAPVRGVMAGSGALVAETTELVRRLGAPVELVGEADDVAALLAQASVVSVFSRYEALTFAVQEAMWVGRPVVASDLPGIRWLVGDTGALVDGAVAAAEAFVRFAERDVAERAGQEAAARIRSLLDPASPWPQVEQAYAAP